MKFTRNIILTIAVAQVSLGISLTFIIGGLPEIEIFKLVNIAGLLFDIFGVLILADFIFERSERFSYVFDFIFAFSMMALMLIPMGIILGQIIGIFFDLPSTKSVTSFAAGMMLYVGIPLYAMDSLGDAFNLGFYKRIKFRTKFLGWYFIISGFILQFMAAIIDLTN